MNIQGSQNSITIKIRIYRVVKIPFIYYKNMNMRGGPNFIYYKNMNIQDSQNFIYYKNMNICGTWWSKFHLCGYYKNMNILWSKLHLL